MRKNVQTAIRLAVRPHTPPQAALATEVNVHTAQMATFLCEVFQMLLSTLLAEGDVDGFNRVASYVLTEHERLLAAQDLR